MGCLRSPFPDTDETPRPEPRGLRPWSSSSYAHTDEIAEDETPRPEPRGLRRKTPTQGSYLRLRFPTRRNTETRTEGIATRNIASFSNQPASPKTTKHRDPNRGDCGRAETRARYQGRPVQDETPRPEPRGLRHGHAGHRAQPRLPVLDETSRPEPRGLRHKGELSALQDQPYALSDETPRPEPRGLRLPSLPLRVRAQEDRIDETPRPEPRGLRRNPEW